ncbi:MAG: dienelactone hydrolase family protein, partial [Planctomycetota bacterium]
MAGVDGRIRDLARVYAEEGYVVAVPDLFWLSGIETQDIAGSLLDWEFWFFQDDLIESGALGAVTPPLALEPALEDVEHTLDALRGHEACTGRVAVVGYGLGATLAVFAAARLDVDAAVAYDPAGLRRALPELQRRSAPLLVQAGLRDTPDWIEKLERFRDAAAALPSVTVLLLDEPCDFALAGPDGGEPGVLRAHSRTIAHLRRAIGPCFDIEKSWDAHLSALFEHRDADLAMRSVARDPSIYFVPTVSGARGTVAVRELYERGIIPALPASLRIRTVSRTIGPDRIVDEVVLGFTHDHFMSFLLPGIDPTGRRVELPLVLSATFRGDRIWRQQVYWDQASLLAQIGRLDAHALPVAGVEEALSLLAPMH